jgi:endonuclease YncB( thermonuclease family)
VTDRKTQNDDAKAQPSKAPSKTGDSEDKGQSSKALAQTLGKFIALALVVILALLIEHYCSYKPPAFGPDAKITAIDGDSLRAGNGDEYRLFGIDAPELHQTCKDSSGKSWLCGRAAKAKLTTLMKAGGVNCEAKATDRYNRIVAICSAVIERIEEVGHARAARAVRR